MAPNREYNYIFNTKASNLSLGDYAWNITKFYVQLSCVYDLNIIPEMDLGKYKSKDPMI